MYLVLILKDLSNSIPPRSSFSRFSILNFFVVVENLEFYKFISKCTLIYVRLIVHTHAYMFKSYSSQSRRVSLFKLQQKSLRVKKF